MKLYCRQPVRTGRWIRWQCFRTCSGSLLSVHTQPHTMANSNSNKISFKLLLVYDMRKFQVFTASRNDTLCTHEMCTMCGGGGWVRVQHITFCCMFRQASAPANWCETCLSLHILRATCVHLNCCHLICLCTRTRQPTLHANVVVIQPTQHCSVAVHICSSTHSTHSADEMRNYWFSFEFSLIRSRRDLSQPIHSIPSFGCSMFHIEFVTIDKSFCIDKAIKRFINFV